MFKYRWLEESDYEQLCQWWKAWRWTPPHKELLPDNGKCGVMVSKDGVNICAGFIYFTNSKFAIIEYIISNFEIKDKPTRKEALNKLIDTLHKIGKSNGFKMAFTSVKDENLKNVYVNRGYIEGTKNSTEMIKLL